MAFQTILLNLIAICLRYVKTQIHTLEITRARDVRNCAVQKTTFIIVHNINFRFHAQQKKAAIRLRFEVNEQNTKI